MVLILEIFFGLFGREYLFLFCPCGCYFAACVCYAVKVFAYLLCTCESPCQLLLPPNYNSHNPESRAWVFLPPDNV